MGRIAAGGISGLVELITQHGEAIDFDLRQHCRISLRDVIDGRVTFRELRGLIANLPPDGTALWRASRRESKGKPGTVKAPPDEWWTPERDLLALIADQQAVLIWMQTKDAKTGTNRPKPIPRPGVTTGDTTFGTAMSAEALLAILRPASE